MPPDRLDIPKQFSTLNQLGEPVEVFRSKASLFLRVPAALVSFLAFGIFLVYALFTLSEMWSGNHFPPEIFEAIIPWLFASLAAFLIGALVLWKIYASFQRAAVVYTDGFAYSDRKGVKALKWTQVQEVTARIVRNYTYGIHIGTTHAYTLLSTSGEKLVINDSLKKVENFYNYLQNNTLQLRYQRLADLYNQGDQVRFGPVSISKQSGLQVGKKSFSWDEIEKITVNQGILSVIKKSGGWRSGITAESGSIPNLHVLLSILDQVVGLTTEG